MKCFLSYPSEHDKGEGSHLSRVLTRLGHDVVEVNTAASGRHLSRAGRSIQGYSCDTSLLELIDAAGTPDIFLYVEPLGLIPRGLESSPFPTACVISDMHRNARSRVLLSTLFDHVFIYHRNYLDHFSHRTPGSTHWLPYACDTEFFKDLGVARDLDVAFVGQLFSPASERHRLIGDLSRRHRMNEQRNYLQKEIPEIYSRAKIVVNLPLADDLNFRFFEALSCGALLLTRRNRSGQEDLFKEGIHFAAFDSPAELNEKVDYYLSHPDERERIAKAGHDEVLRNHTLEIRLRTLLDLVRSGPVASAPVRRMGPSDVLRTYASWYERSGLVEALLALAAEQPKASWNRVRLLATAAKALLRRAIGRW